MGTDDIKISKFPKYVTELDLRNFLFKEEIFKKIINIHGSILEMGVLFGGGLMSWAKLSSIFEPANYSRKIVGFDTFSGFPNITKEDKITKYVKNPFEANVYENISKEFTTKIKAFKQFKSEIHKMPHPRSFEYIEALAKLRGMESGFLKAEAFRLISNRRD